MVVSRFGSVVLGAIVGALAGCTDGGQSGVEGDRSMGCWGKETALAADARAPLLGFSAEEVLERVEGGFDVPLVWATSNGSGLVAGAEATTATLTISYSSAPIRQVTRTRRQKFEGIDCATTLETLVELSIVTEDGALDETLGARLAAFPDGDVTLAATVEHNQVRGSIEFEAMRGGGTLAVDLWRVDDTWGGELTYRAPSWCKYAIASWEPRCARVALEDFEKRSEVASELAAFRRGVSLRSTSGETLEIQLEPSSEHGCERRGNWNGTTRDGAHALELLAAATLIWNDGSILRLPERMWVTADSLYFSGYYGATTPERRAELALDRFAVDESRAATLHFGVSSSSGQLAWVEVSSLTRAETLGSIDGTLDGSNSPLCYGHDPEDVAIISLSPEKADR